MSTDTKEQDFERLKMIVCRIWKLEAQAGALLGELQREAGALRLDGELPLCGRMFEALRSAHSHLARAGEVGP